jgi:hypothetical protein
MNTSLIRWFALLVLALFVPVVLADDSSNAELARLIKQLGHDDFEKREAAKKGLAEIGEPALGALNKAQTSNEPEVRFRAEEIITVIEIKLYPELILRGHTSSCRCICVSADGKRLLTGSGDRTLQLWDADTGKSLRVFKGHTDCVNGAALSPSASACCRAARIAPCVCGTRRPARSSPS